MCLRDTTFMVPPSPVAVMRMSNKWRRSSKKGREGGQKRGEEIIIDVSFHKSQAPFQNYLSHDQVITHAYHVIIYF